MGIGGLFFTFLTGVLINPSSKLEQESISIPFYMFSGLILIVIAYSVILIRKIKLKNKTLEKELKTRKEVEKLLKIAEKEKELILNNINETILFIDNDHNILWANKSNLLPLLPEDKSIIGDKCYKVFFGRDDICPQCVYPTKETSYVEHYIPEKNIYLGWHITPVFDDDGNTKGYVKTIEDITEKKLTEKALREAKEKAEESDKLKSAFLANMSHEIRTPMNAIIGFSELLNDPQISEQERKDYISIIQSNGHQLLKIISDLLVFSQIESGQLKIQKKNIRLVETMNEVYQQFIEEKRRLKKDQIEIHFDKNGIDNDFSFHSDPVRIRQILYNLMTNALKFTSSGSVTLGVKKENNDIKIYVSDTGCGIHPEKLDRIFKRFSQADDTLSRRFEGAGLGLAISKELVSLLGGSLHVKSEVDKGSTFWINMPLKNNRQIK